jgi:hypothetical protein
MAFALRVRRRSTVASLRRQERRALGFGIDQRLRLSEQNGWRYVMIARSDVRFWPLADMADSKIEGRIYASSRKI